MNLVSKALIGASVIALLGGCSLFSKSDSASSSSSPSSSSTETASNAAPSTVPSANLPPLTKTSPVEGGTPAPATGTNDAFATIGIALSDVQNPKKTLAHATVKDVKGEAVGEVKSVRVAKDGKVASVSVAVGKRTFALKSDTLTYLQAENTIMSQQSKAEITNTK